MAGMTRLSWMVAVLVAGCASPAPTAPDAPPPAGDGDGTQRPIPSTEGLRLSILAGDNQSGIVGRQLDLPLRVVVTENGSPKQGVEVRFEIASGTGQLADVPLTDGLGVTRTTYRVLAFGEHRLIAGIVDSRTSWVTFTATGGYGPPTSIIPLIPDYQMAATGTPTPIAPVFLVRDYGGNPLAGIPVAWFVLEGGGVLVSPDSVTDANGLARVGAWILGPQLGRQTILARVAGTGLERNLHANATEPTGP